MKPEVFLMPAIEQAIDQLFPGVSVPIEFQSTRKDFEGDITLVIFPMLRAIKTNPEALGRQLGEFLTQQLPQVSGFNVVKGFLNISFSDAFFIESLKQM
ncbi:MAG: arginine--tRNA ligase, partial [Flavobacteriaceae bacterium]